MMPAWTLLRPHQWLKNGFVLVGLLFGHYWNDPGLVMAVAIGFVAFCMASSAVYVFNDYHDREADARHPRKKMRPIASGSVSLRSARMLVAALVAGALSLPAWFGLWGVMAAWLPISPSISRIPSSSSMWSWWTCSASWRDS